MKGIFPRARWSLDGDGETLGEMDRSTLLRRKRTNEKARIFPSLNDKPSDGVSCDSKLALMVRWMKPLVLIGIHGPISRLER